MSDPNPPRGEPGHRYTRDEAAEVMATPMDQVNARLADQAAANRPAVERAIRTLTGHGDK